jgi:carbohydrate diacid regulator
LVKNIYQSLINQVKEVIDQEFGIIDITGTIIASTDESKLGLDDPRILKVLDSSENYICFNEVTYQKVLVRDKVEMVAYVHSVEETYRKYLAFITFNIQSLKTFYDEKYDKNNFMKNIISDSVLPGDITIKSKDLHINCNAFRAVFFIKTKKTNDVFLFETVQELFPNRNKDFVIVLDDECVVLIKEVKAIDDFKEIKKTATVIIDTLNTESMVKALIGIGTIVDNLNELGRSFKEAKAALKIGSIFEVDKSIISYDNLGLGRLIYQIPENLCRLFLKEVFKQGSIEALDSEYLFTIQKFFENNLNVSETSRQMFVHRNTLVYRLDKIQKVTGLDLTKFDDAIILKFAMLVSRYLDKDKKKV